MFKLLRYYAIASAVPIFLAIGGLLILYRESALNDLVRMTEEQNVVLSQALANAVWHHFSDYVTTVSETDGDILRARPETAEIHERLEEAVAGLPVLKIKIYNLDGLTVFSSEQSQIGADKSDSPGFVAAAQEGHYRSKLSFRETFYSFDGTIYDRYVVESYLPIRIEGRPIEGVFEVYSEVTHLMAVIESQVEKLAILLSLIFASFYLILFLIVRHGERILHRQYAKLQNAEAELKDFALVSSDWFWQMDENLRFSYFSGRFKEITGVAPEQLLGKTREQTGIPGVEPEVWRRHLDDLASHRPFRNFVHPRTKSDGEIAWLSISGTPVQDENGKFKGYRGTGSDITELKRAEARAERAQRQLVEAIESISEGFALFDSDDLLTLYNSKYCDFYHGDRDDIRLGMSFGSLLRQSMTSAIDPDEFNPDAKAWFEWRVNQHRDPKRPFEIRLQDSRYVRVSEHGTPDGGTAVVTTDITELKRRELDLQAATKQAEQASEAKSNFLARMSHEIRTPMNGVLGMVDLLSRSELTDRQRRFAKTAHNSAETLLDIINDILDFSRIEAGKVELDEVDFNLHETVADAADLLAESAQSKGLELAVHLANDTPLWVRGDPVRLRQVLVNLLGNAVKFTDSGEVVLRSTVVEETGSTTLLRFEVQDSGIGIDPQVQSRLFDSFGQADGSITRRFGGTGLGLSIAKQLVTMMKGDIGVESAPGRGSTFWFTASMPRAAQRPVPLRESAHTMPGVRVLVVDNSPTIRAILHDCLTAWNMFPVTAGSGSTALKSLRWAIEQAAPFDVLLLGTTIPDMTEVALAEAIKTDPDIAATRLILLTPVSWQGDLYKAREAGFSAFVTKPLRQSELYDEIVTVMNPKLSQVHSSVTMGTAKSQAQAAKRIAGRILIAEDNEVNEELAREYLTALGCSHDVAHNGWEALEAYERNHYDLILMDCHMPELDGLEATRRIRAQEARHAQARVPIVALTANAFEGDREQCLAAGMDDFLSKPFDLESLAAILERWIDGDLYAASVEIADASSNRDDTETASDHVEPISERGKEAKPSRIPHDVSLSVPSYVSKKVIGIYLTTTPKLLADLRSALDSGDLVKAERLAHSLKSSSAALGATELSEHCRELELMARQRTVIDAPLSLTKIENSFDQTRIVLADVVEDSLEVGAMAL